MDKVMFYIVCAMDVLWMYIVHEGISGSRRDKAEVIVASIIMVPLLAALTTLIYQFAEI